jgi:hypothetical protein
MRDIFERVGLMVKNTCFLLVKDHFVIRDIFERVGLMVKNMCFLLGGHMFKSKWRQGMYTFVDFSSEITWRRGSLVPQTKGSHTPIWCLAWL